MVTLVCHPEQDQEFKVLSSKARLKPTWDTWDPISKRKKITLKKPNSCPLSWQFTRAVTELQEGGATYPGPYTGILKTFLSTLG